MKIKLTILFILFFLCKPLPFCENSNFLKDFVKSFEIEKDFVYLSRFPTSNYFDQLGRKFAILGYENGSFEAWGFPVKILRNLELSFILPDRVEPEPGWKFLKRFEATPFAKILTYSNQYFTLREIIIVPRNLSGALLLLDFSTVRPINLILSFIPSLQPMWPAGIGGQYCFWDENLNAYIISESSRKFNAIIGSPSAIKISSPPAHQFSDIPYQFKLELPLISRSEYFIPVVIAGGKYPRDEVKRVYQELLTEPEKFYIENLKYYRDFMEKTLKIETPDSEINRAFSLAKISLDNLFIENPDLGSSLVAGFGVSGGSGRPGFGWFFGGDAFINSLSLLSYGNFEPVKKSLEFFRKFQREDGKITHEISQSAGIIRWFEDYPFAFIHADTTPYYITAFWEYIKTTHDISFLKDSWDSLKKAFNWCVSTDGDGDGLMDNKKAGLGALEFGEMINIKTDIYLASVWIKALESFSKMAEIVGDKELKAKAENLFQKGLKNLKEKFWDEEKDSYIYAIGDKDEKVKAMTPWSSFPTSFGLLDDEKTMKTMEKIASSDISTPWGCRILSSKEKIYDPLNYNYGAVWPFITGFATLSLYKLHQDLPAFYLLKGLARNHLEFSYSGCHEVFSGNNFIPLDESVPHQGFSSNGLLLPLIRGLLGISVDSINDVLCFEPQIPPNWSFLNVENIFIKNSKFSLYLKKSKNEISLKVKKSGDDRIFFLFSPALPYWTKIKSVKLNGKAHSFKVGKNQGKEILEIKFEPGRDNNLIIQMEEGLSFILNDSSIQIGEEDSTLKVTGIYEKEGKLELNLEGISGKEYILRVKNPALIKKVEGGKLEKESIIILFNKGKGGFEHKKIIIYNR